MTTKKQIAIKAKCTKCGDFMESSIGEPIVVYCFCGDSYLDGRERAPDTYRIGGRAELLEWSTTHDITITYGVIKEENAQS